MKNILKNNLIFVLTLAAFIFAPAQNAQAAWGGYDSSFGFLGAAFDTPTDHYPKSVAVQPDGKILVTGYRQLSTGKRMFLRRYLSNGQLDTNFGSNGAAVSNALLITSADYRGAAIAVQPDGKIAVAGIGNNYYAVWRFNSNGSSDSTIGYGGYRSLSGYTGNADPALAVQNNKLILGVAKGGNAALIRLNTNGTLDTSFGDQGEAVTGIYSGGGIYVLVENETGKITIGGLNMANYSSAVAERRLPDGQTDPDFVSGIGSGIYYGVGGFIRLANQKYVFQGANPGYYPIQPPAARLIEFDSTGALESNAVYQEGADDNNCPSILAQQTDGKVVAHGMGRLYRFNAELDPYSAEINFCSSFANYTNLTRGVLQADNKMIVAGRYNNKLMLVRTLAN